MLESPIFLQLVMIIMCGVVRAPTSNIPYELEDTVGKDVVSIRSPLDLAFSIKTVKDKLNFNLFSGVQIDKVWSPSRSGIRVSLHQLLISKLNAISPVPIVFIKQGKTPVAITDFSSLPIATEIDLSSEGDFASWSQSEPTLTLCILTMPCMYQFHLL